MSSEHDPGAAEPPRTPGENEPLVRPLASGEAEPGRAGEADPGPAGEPAPPPSGRPAPAGRQTPGNMLPRRERRRSRLERLLVRLVATCGIVGIGVAIAAVMVSSNSQGWLVGLVVSIVTVVLAAILWSSRQL
jgi:hypothetical protein